MTGDAVSDQQAEVPAVPGVTRWRQKHPPEVEAMHWDGSVSGATAVIDWILANGSTARYHDGRAASGIGIPCVLSINTETGTTTAVPGDWVVMRRYGSFWPWTEETLTARYEPAGSPLTPSQCDRLRHMVTEYGDALSAVRRALDLAGRPGLRSPEDADVIKAAREALRVLEGSEEEDGRG